MNRRSSSRGVFKSKVLCSPDGTAGRRRRKRLVPVVIAVALGFTASSLPVRAHHDPWASPAQSCRLGAVPIYACWNPQAGRLMPTSTPDHPERYPSLSGWDFRINLPHVRYQKARAGTGSPPALVGVTEGRPEDGTLASFNHVNNSVWVFRVDPDGRAVYKVVPSRRSLTSAQMDNVTSLISDWTVVGPSGSPALRSDERPAVTVIGSGLGAATVHVVARATDGALWHTSRPVSSTDTSSWPTAWEPIGAVATARPSIERAFDGRLAVAWRGEANELRVRLRATDWGPTETIPDVAGGAPKLVWDGTALNVFYVTGGRVTHRAIAQPQPPTASAPSTVVPTITGGEDFDAVAFNSRLHVAMRDGRFRSLSQPIRYTASTTAPGIVPVWTSASDTGLSSARPPELAAHHDLLFILATALDGTVRYARKDPNARGADLGGADRFVGATVLDQGTPGSYTGIETLSFNEDIYLAAQRTHADDSSQTGTYAVNFSRAAFKNVAVGEHGMDLMWGRADPNKASQTFGIGSDIPMVGDFDGDKDLDAIRFRQTAEFCEATTTRTTTTPTTTAICPRPNPVYVARATSSTGRYGANELWHTNFSPAGSRPLVGDFNGDGKEDVVSFKQAAESGVGPAPVRVALSTGSSFGAGQVWHTSFAPSGHTPAVGDFNGDGKDDVIAFAQRAETGVGPAPVRVALSTGSGFGTAQVWHTFFALSGEIPAVGDFNGDGKDDVVTFTQKTQYYSNGTPIGPAVVWSSMSTGSQFQTSTIWHTDFSRAGDIPVVGEVTMDGRDDVLTYNPGTGTNGAGKQSILYASSTGGRFDRPVEWISDWRHETKPFVGRRPRPTDPAPGRNVTARTLGHITQVQADFRKPIADVIGFRDGAIYADIGLWDLPAMAGTPWERYRMLTGTSHGIAMFPQWIWEGSNPCIRPGHMFIMAGHVGLGGRDATWPTEFSGEGHMLEEVGHSLMRNCFAIGGAPDTFGMHDDIYTKSIADGGFDANNFGQMCAAGSARSTNLRGFLDCRDPEHYFLRLNIHYRLHGQLFVKKITSETDGAMKERLRAQYLWLKTNWYGGAEFKGFDGDGGGAICLPGECPPPS